MAEERLGSRILMENEWARVWDDRVSPGETQHVHTHRRPYFAVVAEGERGETVGEDGTVLRTFEFNPGDVFFFGPEALPVTHSLRNTGNKEIAVVILELLR